MSVARFALVLLPLSSCLVPEGSLPSVEVNASVKNQHNHRGMVQNEKGVAHLGAEVWLPTVDGGTVGFRAGGFMDLSNDTGDAWLPNGHQHKFTELDLVAWYSRTFDKVDVTVGLLSYILPNGLEYPFGERGETKEAFVTVSTEVVTVRPELTIHYDFDEVEDFYVNAAVSRDFPIDEHWSADARISAGYSGEDHSLWAYDLDENALTDVRATGTVWYQYNANTRFMGRVGGSTIIDSTIEDWFELLGIESDNLWLELGTTWSF